VVILGTFLAHGRAMETVASSFVRDFPASQLTTGWARADMATFFVKVSQFDFLVGFVKLERKGIY